MSESIWRSRGRSLALLCITSTIFLTGCSNKHQASYNGGNHSYFHPSQGGNSGSSSKSSSFQADRKVGQNSYIGKQDKLTKGEGSAAMHRATLRPYSTFGIRYFPKIDPINSEHFGIASWYGPKFHGKKTSNGEIYDMHGMTAAHKTLPMHTIVDVTHRKSGKKIRVRINDRGPFVKGRIIDLSFTAGKALGLDKTGTAPVKVDVISYDTYISSYSNQKKHKIDTKYGIQLGSFANKNSADTLKEEASVKYGRDVKLKSFQKGSNTVYRVIISGFSDENIAEDFKNRYALNSAVIIAE